MKNKNLKMFVSTVLFVGFVGVEAQARKMTSPITHGKPWIETRLTYSITAEELAFKYYGNQEDVKEIIKANMMIRSGADLLRKDMIIHIPVTHNFKDQPERLGWVSSSGINF